MKNSNLVSFLILIVIIGYQFGIWTLNALVHPSWLDFPTVPIIALGAVAFFVALGLQVNNLWSKGVQEVQDDKEFLGEVNG